MPRLYSTTSKVNTLLKFFAGGAVLSVGFVAPNAVQLLDTKYFKSKKSNSAAETEEYKRLLRHMKRLKLINIEKLADGKSYVTLTDAGVDRLKEASLEDIEIPPAKSWDGKWRIVSFDIPAAQRHERYTFLHHLHRLGFVRSLQSMWVYPFECAKEVHELAVACGVSKHVLIITGELT